MFNVNKRKTNSKISKTKLTANINTSISSKLWDDTDSADDVKENNNDLELSAIIDDDLNDEDEDRDTDNDEDDDDEDDNILIDTDFTDSDDDDDVDFQCCAHNIQFLNDFDFDINNKYESKHNELNRTESRNLNNNYNRIINKNRESLDSF